MIAELHRNLGLAAIMTLVLTIYLDGAYWEYTRLVGLVFGIMGVIVFIMGLAVSLATPKVRPNYPLLLYVLVLSLATVYSTAKRGYSCAHALLALISVIALTHLYIIGIERSRSTGQGPEASSQQEGQEPR